MITVNLINDPTFGHLPPVDEMKRIISYYILKNKGVRVIPVIGEQSSSEQVNLFCKAYLIAVNNLN